MVYSNREAKTDLDIDRITLYNHMDSEEYQMVLYPGIQVGNKDSMLIPETMIKIRMRDKFVVVKEGPW